MEIPHRTDNHNNVQTHSTSAYKLLEKDGSCAAQEEQSCLFTNVSCEQATLTQSGVEAAIKTAVVACESLNTSGVLKPYPCVHGNSKDALEKDLYDLAASLENVQISKPSSEPFSQINGCIKGDSTLFDGGKLSYSTSLDVVGEQLLPSIEGSKQSRGHNVANEVFQGSSLVRTKEKKLGSSVVSEPVSLTGISAKNKFLSILTSFPPMRCPRKKLLILDINGILADIVYPAPRGYKADIKIAGRAVFTRPHCYDFFSFCVERFRVGVWSSRSKKIVDRVLHYLIGDLKEQLTFCWDISHCTKSQFRTLENRHKVLVFKELKKLWENYDSSLPWDRGDYSESNTLLLDDSPYKALLNPPHTAVFPYSFSFEDHADTSIGPDGNIRAYLEEVAMADNVQKYIEGHPFGQSAITERSTSWTFYNKVIQRQYADCCGK